jgi:tRNA(His) guanylyltransferase
MSDIGVRMKSYENKRKLEKGAVIVRVDGKAFHTWTKNIEARKPFDGAVMDSMIDATAFTSEKMQGFKLAYTQSDEATFLLTNIGDKEELWFGGKLDKIVSLAASTFTYYFNKAFGYFVTSRGYPEVPAFFDARAHNIPIEDAANNFFWRQQDWERNSVHMVGRAHFSHKQLYGRSLIDIKEMLLVEGVDWDKLPSDEKYGTYVSKNGYVSSKLNYYEINELAGIDVT